MLKCDKCGFGHETIKELNECLSWDEIVKECIRAGHPIIRRDWHFGSNEYCVCGQRNEPRITKTVTDLLTEDEGAQQMSDVACCAHLILKYDTEPVGNGAVRGFWRCQDCKVKFGLEPLAAPSVSGETSAGQPPELIKPPFQKALTVIMFRDESDKQAEKDVNAILDGTSTVLRIGVPELYFHHLRLRVAKDPSLAEKIAVFYVDGSAPRHVGLRFEDQENWPGGMWQGGWEKEVEIGKIQRAKQDKANMQPVGLSFDDELKWPAGFCQEFLAKEVEIGKAREDKK